MMKETIVIAALLLVAPAALADTAFESFPAAANRSVVFDTVRPKKKIDTWITAHFVHKKKVDGKWVQQSSSDRLTVNLDEHDGVMPGVTVCINPKTGRGSIRGDRCRMSFDVEQLAGRAKSGETLWHRTRLWLENEYIVFLDSGKLDNATEYLAFVFVDEIQKQAQAEDSAGLTRDRARQIAHGALLKALLEEYGDDARAMLSADVSDERLSVRRETDAGLKETEGGKKAIWVALLLAKGGGHSGFAIIHDGDGTVLKLLIPTQAGRKDALHRVQKWVKERGAPAKIEWQPNGGYRMEWRVSEREMALLGPFVISVHPEGEPHVHARR